MIFVIDSYGRSSAFAMGWWFIFWLSPIRNQVHLWRIVDIRYCIEMVQEMVLILMRVFDTCLVGMARSLCRDCIKRMCVVLYAPIVMTKSGLTFHPLTSMSSITYWYLSIFTNIEGAISIVAIGEFNELHSEVRKEFNRGCWFIRKSYDS